MWQISAERQRRHEREAQERQERHRAQARLIAAVYDPEEYAESRNAEGNRTGIELINGSPEPVYRLVAIVNIQGAEHDGTSLQPVARRLRPPFPAPARAQLVKGQPAAQIRFT